MSENSYDLMTFDSKNMLCIKKKIIKIDEGLKTLMYQFLDQRLHLTL